MKGLARLLPWWRVQRLGRWIFWPRRRLADARENEAISAVLGLVLREDSCCVDAGSHLGHFLWEFERLAPAGRHVAVEPLPDLAARLRRHFPRVEVFEAALSDAPGESSFCHVTGMPGVSGLRRTALMGSRRAVQEIRVRVARLDDLIAEGARIDLIKLDVEGAEAQALRGARRIIRSCRPHVIFEYEPAAAAAYGTTAGTLHELLTGDLGLEVFGLDGTGPLSERDFASPWRRPDRWNFWARPPAWRLPAGRSSRR